MLICCSISNFVVSIDLEHSACANLRLKFEVEDASSASTRGQRSNVWRQSPLQGMIIYGYIDHQNANGSFIFGRLIVSSGILYNELN